MHVFINNFSYSFGLNFISMLIRVVYIFILPKVISVADFSYWQLYYLYASFIHLLHFGLVDGIYLKNGGKFYDDLDKKNIASQFYILVLIGILSAFSIYFASKLLVLDKNKTYLITIICLDIVLMLPRTLLSAIFQATGKIKEYSIALLIETIVSFVLVLLLLVFGVRNFQFIIIADLVSKVCSLTISIMFAKDICSYVIIKTLNFMEALNNIKIGINLLISNLSGVIILGIAKLFIEQKWDLVTFSKVSLSLSISNMGLVVVSAVAVVLFPFVKRMGDNEKREVYIFFRKCMSFIFYIILCFYYPIVFFLKQWLPIYHDSFTYLALLAPIGIFECRWVMLSNSYLKSFRCEKSILKISVLSIVLITLISVIVVSITDKLQILLFGILFTLITRTYISDSMVCEHLNVEYTNSFKLDLFVTIIFIICNYYISNFIGALLYLIFIIIIILKHKYEIRQLYFNFIKYKE